MSWEKHKSTIRQWLAKWLVKFKRIKSVTFSAEEINQLLSGNLPEKFDIHVPGCKGEVEIQTATVSMPQLSDHFDIHLFCALRIESLGNPIYRAHIDIKGVAWPAYDNHQKLIYLNQIKVEKISLVQDEYSLLNDTRQIISLMVPGPLKSVLGVTMKTTLNIISNGSYKDAQQYLSLYMFGNKQKVLDYHKPELEKVVKHLNDSGDLQYPLDNNIFEEQLFADLGKEVKIKNGELHFIFHH